MNQLDISKHPCLSCGACCASYRVSFDVEESKLNNKNRDWCVPVNMTENNGNSTFSMKGTNQKHRPSCFALKGEIGKKVTCEIYINRPSPCRQFTASFEDGKRHPRCDEARKKHGLKPLRPESFKGVYCKDIEFNWVSGD